jgi:uncharacterized DUF497 family protein
MGRLYLLVAWSLAAARHALEKHEVTEEELQSLFAAGVVVVNAPAGRINALGLSHTGKVLAAILEERETGIYWLVSARPMEPGEIKVFVERGGLD